MKQTKTAIIFDLDGTICDTLADLAICNNKALQDYGLPAHSPDEYRFIVGNGIDKQIKRSIGAEHYSQELAQKVKEAFHAYYQKGYRDAIRSYDGMQEALLELKQMGFSLGVLSNKPDEFTQIICREQYGEIFDIVRGHCKGAAVKPDPTVLKEMLNILHVKPQDCLYCGDTGVDMQTGAGAGIITIGALWGFRSLQELMENGAKLLAESPGQLPKLADTWQKCQTKLRGEGI